MIYEALNNMQMLNRHQHNHIQMESANQHAALLQAALHSNAHNKKDEQRWFCWKIALIYLNVLIKTP